MIKNILPIIFFFSTLASSAQFLAKMEVKEPIPGVCNNKEVYALFPSMKGQEVAQCPMTEDSILNRLNTDIKYISLHKKYKGKTSIDIVINCNGEVVQCKIDDKLKVPELKAELEAVFTTLGIWTAGKLNNKAVDSVKIYSLVFAKGLISWE